jgi:hypothetical protein
MSLLNEFKRLPLWGKSAVITFILLIPFYILSFYLFKPSILNYQWYVILSIAGAIALAYFLLNMVNVYLFVHLIENDEQERQIMFTIALFVQPFIELLIAIALAYFFSFSFKTTTIALLGLNAWRCLFYSIGFFFKYRKP